MEAVTFSGTGGIRNLARSDPTNISTGVGGQTHLHAVGGGPPLTFVSTVVVGECHLMESKMHTTGKMQKLIEGIAIEGEWDRLVGALGQIIDKVQYKAQIQAGYVSFSTSFASAESGVLTYYDVAWSLLMHSQLPRLLGCVVLVLLILSPMVQALEM